ncbi:MAG TPA: hypothetical protein VFP16_00825 [Vicinamibacterales bacterium]|nr:hypothetical protein [Vicinamibacterales bacterium]
MKSNENVAGGEEWPHHSVLGRRVIESEGVADFVNSEQFEVEGSGAEAVSELP